jgi:hypothetical protein
VVGARGEPAVPGGLYLLVVARDDSQPADRLRHCHDHRLGLVASLGEKPGLLDEVSADAHGRFDDDVDAPVHQVLLGHCRPATPVQAGVDGGGLVVLGQQPAVLGVVGLVEVAVDHDRRTPRAQAVDHGFRGCRLTGAGLPSDEHDAGRRLRCAGGQLLRQDLLLEDAAGGRLAQQVAAWINLAQRRSAAAACGPRSRRIRSTAAVSIERNCRRVTTRLARLARNAEIQSWSGSATFCSAVICAVSAAASCARTSNAASNRAESSVDHSLGGKPPRTDRVGNCGRSCSLMRPLWQVLLPVLIADVLGVATRTHTFATPYLQRRAHDPAALTALTKLQELLGHASLETTRRYLHHTRDEHERSMLAPERNVLDVAAATRPTRV